MLIRTVTKDHYYNRKYMRRERLLAYIDQIGVITQLSEPQDTILEIGKGNGYLASFFRQYLNYSVTTVDFDPDLEPDICADISRPDFRLSGVFDIGVCFEVFEHIPWEDLPQAVENLLRHVRKYAIVSVPDTNFFIQLKFTLLWLRLIPLAKTISIPRFMGNQKTIGDDHQWEIGIQRNGRRVTKTHLIGEIFGKENIIDEFRGREFPGHHFFVLKGRASG